MGGIKYDEEKHKLHLIYKLGLSDDPSVHLANRLACVSFFVIASVSLAIKPDNWIECHCPFVCRSELKLNEFINDYCWTMNTYVVDFNQSFPTDTLTRKEMEIQYYQWIYLILIFQAMLFYAPRMFWLGFIGYSDLNIKVLLQMAEKATLVSESECKDVSNIEIAVQYLMKYLKIRNYVSRRYRTLERPMEILVSLGFHKGNYLVLIFLSTSLMYTISTAFQIWMVDILLGIDFKTLGCDFLLRAINGEPLNDPRRFPTITFCDLEIRQMTNVQTWTVQCALLLNLYSEKVFIVDWFILITMTFVNFTYFMFNLISTLLPCRAEDYILKFLYADSVRFDQNPSFPEQLTKTQINFIHSYLRRDGVFLIWLISSKVNQVVASEIVIELWKKYKQ